MDAGIVVCTWLHLIVMVIWIDHMVNALLLFEPLTSKYIRGNEFSDFISEYRNRDRPVALASIFIFFITGFVLLLLDEHYAGIGGIFANSWSTIISIKHILVLAMVGLGVYQGTRVMPNLAEASKKIYSQGPVKPEVAVAVLRYKKIRKIVTQLLCALAIVVLLLTAIGEVL